MSNTTDKQQLFLDNEKLIGFTLKKYFPIVYRDAEKMEDYRSIGSIGLMKACNNYDTKFGTAFSTYAVSIIWGEIKRFSRDNTPIKYAREIKDLAYKILSEYNNSPTEEFEIFLSNKLNKLNISDDYKTGIFNFLTGITSLNEPVSNKSHGLENITFGDVVESSKNIEDEYEYTDFIENISKHLNKQEQKVLTLLLNDENQIVIAKKLNYSQAQISRMEYTIKMYTIKELLLSGYYDSACAMLCKMHRIKLTKSKFLSLKHKFYLNFSTCPLHILEKYELLDFIKDDNTYSKQNQSNDTNNTNNYSDVNGLEDEKIINTNIKLDIIYEIISLLETFKTNNLRLIS